MSIILVTKSMIKQKIGYKKITKGLSHRNNKEVLENKINRVIAWKHMVFKSICLHIKRKILIK